MKKIMNEILFRSGEEGTILEDAVREKITPEDIAKIKNDINEYASKVKALHIEGVRLTTKISDYRTSNGNFVFKKRDNIAKAIHSLDKIYFTIKEAIMSNNIAKNIKK